ncbi:MAG TPA: thiamine phosphate synthase [Alicyclobacillus sp.]|nr:thiamine phosphate synthase [Alicyclobacillus sp.]
MGLFQIHVVTDGQKAAQELAEVVRKVAQAGADAVQLRYKAAPALELYRLAEQLLPVLDGTSTRLLINDRVDVALAVGAHGVHLAAKSLPVDRVRALLPAPMVVGRSVHSLEEALEAQRSGADYVTFGHVFTTRSKPGVPPRGPDDLRRIVESVDIPVLAIGGITPDNAAEAARTGCAGVAVIGAVMGHANPGAALSALARALEASGAAPAHPFRWPAR